MPFINQRHNQMLNNRSFDRYQNGTEKHTWNKIYFKKIHSFSNFLHKLCKNQKKKTKVSFFSFYFLKNLKNFSFFFNFIENNLMIFKKKKKRTKFAFSGKKDG